MTLTVGITMNRDKFETQALSWAVGACRSLLEVNHIGVRMCGECADVCPGTHRETAKLYVT